MTSLQLRAKRMRAGRCTTSAVTLAERCRAAGALFFVNDRVDVAVAADADGVHVGMHDLPLPATRRLVGRKMIVGFSPLAMANVVMAKREGADYVGLGPVFGTASKADTQPELGCSPWRSKPPPRDCRQSVSVVSTLRTRRRDPGRRGRGGRDQRDSGRAECEAGRPITVTRGQSGQDRAVEDESGSLSSGTQRHALRSTRYGSRNGTFSSSSRPAMTSGWPQCQPPLRNPLRSTTRWQGSLAVVGASAQRPADRSRAARGLPRARAIAP